MGGRTAPLQNFLISDSVPLDIKKTFYQNLPQASSFKAFPTFVAVFMKSLISDFIRDFRSL